ncbi:MAG: FadR family transcriptional regulator [Deltaproteobacteria bacterium]|nr:FadR family transcriptional regulator [Deltaproteobacteria bacterium]
MKNKFEKIGRPRLYEEVSEILEEAILSRRFRPGDPLPSEAELGEQFGVSRTVVREAIRLLQSRGFLEIRRGKNGGAFVLELNPGIISDNLSVLIRAGYVEPEHLTQARIYLEPEVMRLAAINSSEADLDRIEELLQEYDETADNEKRITLNCAFHRRIGKSCGNPFFSILMESIMDFTERFVKTINPMHRVVHRQGEHREIFEAILNRDPEKASRLAQKHLIHLGEEMRVLKEIYLNIINGQGGKFSEPDH